MLLLLPEPQGAHPCGGVFRPFPLAVFRDAAHGETVTKGSEYGAIPDVWRCGQTGIASDPRILFRL